MIIKPKVRGFICTTTHPVGCAANVAEQIAYVKDRGQLSEKGVSDWRLNWLRFSLAH